MWMHHNWNQNQSSIQHYRKHSTILTQSIGEGEGDLDIRKCTNYTYKYYELIHDIAIFHSYG